MGDEGEHVAGTQQRERGPSQRQRIAHVFLGHEAPDEGEAFGGVVGGVEHADPDAVPQIRGGSGDCGVRRLDARDVAEAETLKFAQEASGPGTDLQRYAAAGIILSSVTKFFVR